MREQAHTTSSGEIQPAEQLFYLISLGLRFRHVRSGTYVRLARRSSEHTQRVIPHSPTVPCRPSPTTHPLPLLHLVPPHPTPTPGASGCWVLLVVVVEYHLPHILCEISYLFTLFSTNSSTTPGQSLEWSLRGTVLAPCVCPPPCDDVGLQVAHARGLGCCYVYSAMSCAPPGARSRTKPGAARLRAPGGALRPPPLHTQLQRVKNSST